jgi:hypothetical protein
MGHLLSRHPRVEAVEVALLSLGFDESDRI